MKHLIWLLLLAAVIYLMHARASDYGFPWEQQVVIANYEAVKRYSGGGNGVYVVGEIRNRTRKPVRTVVECRSVPSGMTLTPKATTTVDLQPEEAFPFSVEINSKTDATGAECKIKDWSAGGGLEERIVQSAQRTFRRVRGWF